MRVTDDFPSWSRPVLAIVGVIVLAGVGDFLLSQAGYTGFGALIWALGYGGAIVAAWAAFFHGQEFEPE